MKTKTIILILMAALLVFAFAGCGSNNAGQEQPETEAPQENPGAEAPQQGSLTDGTYVAYSDADPESKGEAKIEFVIKDGKVAEVKIEEIQDGSKGHAAKDLANYAHQPAVDGEKYFKEKFTGISSVAEVQAVDDFAGITHSSEKFKQAAERALAKAAGESGYFDGTFMGYSDTTEEKGFATAYVTVKNGAIESVVLEEWQPDKEKAGAFNLKDYANYPLKEAQEGNDYFTKEFVGATSAADVDAVDDFAGVSHSSENYKAAVKMALEKAQK